jgi:hypothetical protein
MTVSRAGCGSSLAQRTDDDLAGTILTFAIAQAGMN